MLWCRYDRPLYGGRVLVAVGEVSADVVNVDMIGRSMEGAY